MKLAVLALLLALLAACACAPPEPRESVATVESRPGVTTSFIVTAPGGPPTAIAILFAGGDGNLQLWRRSLRMRNNFLVRTRELFAKQGVLALTLDAPSDRRIAGLAGFRTSDKHRADVAAVIRWARSRSPAPLWLIGTSRGTVSVAHLAAAGAAVDGIVLSASVTEWGRRDQPTALDAALDQVGVPALLVHHRQDPCYVTPAAGVERLHAALSGAPRVETLLFDGGREPKSGPCKARSPHGFFGIEEKVVGKIVRRMKAVTPSPPARQ